MISAYVAGIILCILFSAFFSASEMSLSSCNRVRLEHAADNGDRKAAGTLSLLQRFDDALSTILVGNNLVNIACSSLGSVLAILAFGSKYAWISTVIITVLVIICGETVPKIIAQKNATGLAQAFSLPLRVLMTLFYPVTWVVVHLVNRITGRLPEEADAADADLAVEELHSIIETAEDEDVLDEDAVELVSAAIDFAEVTAQEVMTARVDLLAIDVDEDWETVMETLERSHFSRIPVYEGSIDNIIGILFMNHLLKALIDKETVNIRELLMPVTYVYKTMKLPGILSQLQASHQHLAVVTDEYGGTLGIVSLEDVLEELVGDIWDETDVIETDVKKKAEGVFEIDGDTVLSDLAELMGWNEDELDFDSETVGGWCIEMLDGFPPEGSSFTYRDAQVTVLEVEERRVRKVLVRKENESSPEEEKKPETEAKNGRAKRSASVTEEQK